MSKLWEKYSYVILFLIVTFVMGLYLIFNAVNKGDAYIKVTVQQGDSLWSISEDYSQQTGIPTRELVKLLEENNQLYGETLNIGTEIIIPLTIYHDRQNESEYALDIK